MRKTYWSLSKTADRIRKFAGIPAMLASGTSEEWRDYRKAAKEASPLFYWVTDDLIDSIQNFVYYPYDKLYSLSYYFNNRFIEKTHVMTTGLPPGEWADFDTRLLHGVFDTLRRFVEDEKAWMEYVCHSKKYDGVLPFWKRKWPYRYMCRFNEPRLGIEYLTWEATLKQDDEWFGYNWREKTEPEKVAAERLANKRYNQPTDQAKTAAEVLYLYNWWTVTRPARPDPHEASGLDAYYAAQKAKRKADNPDEDDEDVLWISSTNENKETRALLRKLLKKMHSIEARYDKEDTECLTRLINVRKNLWT